VSLGCQHVGFITSESKLLSHYLLQMFQSHVATICMIFIGVRFVCLVSCSFTCVSHHHSASESAWGGIHNRVTSFQEQCWILLKLLTSSLLRWNMFCLKPDEKVVKNIYISCDNQALYQCNYCSLPWKIPGCFLLFIHIVLEANAEPASGNHCCSLLCSSVQSVFKQWSWIWISTNRFIRPSPFHHFHCSLSLHWAIFQAPSFSAFPRALNRVSGYVVDFWTICLKLAIVTLRSNHIQSTLTSLQLT